MAAASQAEIDLDTSTFSLLENLDEAEKDAKAKAFQSAIDAKRELLKGAEGVLAKAREVNAQWKRADIRLQASALVWVHDEKALDGFAAIPDLSPQAVPPSACAN
jgi:hypothetical protein